MNLHLGLLIILTLTNLLLGSLVWQRDKKNKINISFFFLVLILIFWIISLYLSDLPGKYVLFWNKMTLVLGELFAAVFTLFCFLFVKTFPKPLFFDIGLLIIILLVFLTLFTKLVVKEIEFYETGTNIIPGAFYPAVVAWYILCPILGLGKLFTKVKKSSGIEKLQTQYLLIGFFFSAIGILSTNVIIPLFTGSYLYSKYGPFFTTFFIFFTTLAIVRYHLFGLRIILTEIIVVMIALTLLIQALVITNFTLKIVNLGLLFLFLISGYFLIKLTYQEIRTREEIQKAYEKLKQLDIAKTEFLSIASHQLRTPLTAIKGYLSMILEGTYGALPEKIKKPMENVFLSNERMIKLVNDLLSASRIETGKVELNFERADLTEIVENAIKEVEIKAKEKGLYLKFEKRENLPKILVDKEKIRQVVLNLLDNAIRYTNQGGVKVGLRVVKNGLQILVEDTGEGMTKEEISKLFESFSRGSAGQKMWTEGAGLGLYIAKKLVELHRGKIWAESEGKGKGSKFFVELPIK